MGGPLSKVSLVETSSRDLYIGGLSNHLLIWRIKHFLELNFFFEFLSSERKVQVWQIKANCLKYLSLSGTKKPMNDQTINFKNHHIPNIPVAPESQIQDEK